jgi:hypothetical protein
MIVFCSSFWATVIALMVLRLGFWYEDFVWERLTGFYSCPVLLAAGIGGLWLGYRGYVDKEIGPCSAPITLPARWWLWLFLFLAGLLLALTLAASIAKHYPKLLGGS